MDPKKPLKDPTEEETQAAAGDEVVQETGEEAGESEEDEEPQDEEVDPPETETASGEFKRSASETARAEKQARFCEADYRSQHPAELSIDSDDESLLASPNGDENRETKKAPKSNTDKTSAMPEKVKVKKGEKNDEASAQTM